MFGLGEDREPDGRGADHEELLAVPRGDPHDGGCLSVVSVDLAARRTRDVGIAVLRDEGNRIACRLERSHVSALGPIPEVEPLADFLAALCDATASTALLIDGPQAWKDPANGLAHQRICEKALATPGKIGLPEHVLPRSWTRFAVFSIALFDALALRGFPRLGASERSEKSAIEVFPTASWRALGVKPLAGKARESGLEIRSCARRLAECFGVSFDTPPSHDELQAAVAGLAGLALVGHRALAFRAHGVPPFQAGGAWREGSIAVAEPAKSSR